MKSLKSKLVLSLAVIVGLSCTQPVYAQSWKKTAVKEAKTILEKAVKNGETKKAAKEAAEKAARSGSSSSGNAARAGAAATQHVHTESCSSCRGSGRVYVNGYWYSCSNCNGTGKVTVWR